MKDGWGAALAGGWSVNALLVSYSGRPFSVSASGASLNAPGNTQRANQIKPEVAILGNTGPNTSWFDPLAFAPVTTVAFGTVGYNTLRGPDATNLDLGLFRSFNLTERWKMEFRAEALNFTNSPHFGFQTVTSLTCSSIRMVLSEALEGFQPSPPGWCRQRRS